MNLYDTSEHALQPPDSDADRNVLDFALPAVQFSDRHFDTIIEHNLSWTEALFFLHCLGNMESKTGFIHKFKVSELAARFDVNASHFYGEDGYIERINRTGDISLKLEDHKVSGRVKETPGKRLKKNKYPSRYPLKVSVLHKEGLKALVSSGTRKNSVLRMLLCLSLHCDKTTGQLNTFKRARDWGEIIGHCQGVNADRAIDALYELGIADVQRDYHVYGCLEFVAMGQAFLTLHAMKAKEAAKKRKAEKESGWDYRCIEKFLMESFGLNMRSWGRESVQKSFNALVRLLGEEARQMLSKFKKELSPSAPPSEPSEPSESKESRDIGSILFSDAPGSWADVEASRA